MEQIEELKQMAARLAKAQQDYGLGDAAFVSRFRGKKNVPLLGSDRTWQRLRDDEWEGHLDAVKWLARLREICAQLDGGFTLEEIYEDLPFFRAGRAELTRLEGQTRAQRILVALAPTGVGKTVLARTSVARGAKEKMARTYLLLNPTCRESNLNIAARIADALKIESEHARRAADLVKEITTELRKEPRTVFIDDANEGGVALMKLIRHWIDETPSRFVYLAHATEYNRVVHATTAALVEAKQFLRRCIKPAFNDYATGTKIEDVMIVLKHAGCASPRSIVESRLLPVLVTGFNISHLVETLEYLAACENETPSLDEIVKTAEALFPQRTPRRRQEDAK